MLKIRHNFETNSSSEHSLSIRKSQGNYSEAELLHSEMMSEGCTDAIFITTDPNVTEINSRTFWVWNDKTCEIKIWSNDVDFWGSALQILKDPREKLMYVIACILDMNASARKVHFERLNRHLNNLIPGLCVGSQAIEKELFYRKRRSWTNNSLLYSFLRDYRVSLEDFLTNNKYIVVVNLEEFQKMQFLNMVNTSQIVSIYTKQDCPVKDAMAIDENGVWHPTYEGLSFGRSPFRVLGTPEGKARYILAANEFENKDAIIDILRAVYPNLKDIAMPFDSWSSSKYRGYVEDYCIPSGVSVEDLILNKKYVIISDGDEYRVWNSFKETILFNKEEYPNEGPDED